MALKGCKPQVHLRVLLNKHSNGSPERMGGALRAFAGGGGVKMETNILLNRRARLCRLSFSEEPSSRWFPNVLERTHGRGRDLHSDTLRFPGRGFSIYWTPAV